MPLCLLFDTQRSDPPLITVSVMAALPQPESPAQPLAWRFSVGAVREWCGLYAMSEQPEDPTTESVIAHGARHQKSRARFSA